MQVINLGEINFNLICLIFFHCFAPFPVCAEAFNPDEEEEDTEQRVRMNELHHAWPSLRFDRQMSVSHISPHHLCISFREAVSSAVSEEAVLLWNSVPLCPMQLLSHRCFNMILFQRTWELCLCLPSLKVLAFSFLCYSEYLLRQFLKHQCCCGELVKPKDSCSFVAA